MRKVTTLFAALLLCGSAAAQTAGGIRNLPHVAAMAGGMMIEGGGQLLGGIGVSGAPGPENDDICAKAGIAAIADSLEF